MVHLTNKDYALPNFSSIIVEYLKEELEEYWAQVTKYRVGDW